MIVVDLDRNSTVLIPRRICGEEIEQCRPKLHSTVLADGEIEQECRGEEFNSLIDTFEATLS